MTREEMLLRNRIKSGQALYSINNVQMATLMHLTIGQWERRLTHPGKLTYSELCRIDKILKLKLFKEE